MGEGCLFEREGVWGRGGGAGGVCELGGREGGCEGGGGGGGGEVGGGGGGEEPCGGAGDQGAFGLELGSERAGWVEVYECVEFGHVAGGGYERGDDGGDREEEAQVRKAVMGGGLGIRGLASGLVGAA